MKERTPKDFGVLMIIAFAWALMVVGCLASCRTVKNKQSNTVKADSTQIVISKNDIKEISHTETTGDFWTDADTLIGDLKVVK